MLVMILPMSCKGKNALLGIKEKAENSGKIRAALQLEAGGRSPDIDTAGNAQTSNLFSTIINPTQPEEGHMKIFIHYFNFKI